MRTPGTEVPERADGHPRRPGRPAGRPSSTPAHADDARAGRPRRRRCWHYLADGVGRLGGRWPARRPRAGPGGRVPVPHAGLLGATAVEPTAAPARAGPLLLRHDDAGRPGHVAGAHAPARRGADRGRPRRSAGAPAAYAACRPPGHHVTRDAFGGSCYLNNAAIAAPPALGRARPGGGDRRRRPPRQRDAVDLLRRRRADGSVHVDPGAGWFPHFLGFADETGEAGAARTSTCRCRRAPATRLAASGRRGRRPRGRRRGARGVARCGRGGHDPESPLEVTAAGFRAAGRASGALGLPASWSRRAATTSSR